MVTIKRGQPVFRDVREDYDEVKRRKALNAIDDRKLQAKREGAEA